MGGHEEAGTVLAFCFLQQPVDQTALGGREKVVFGLFEEDLGMVGLEVTVVDFQNVFFGELTLIRQLVAQGLLELLAQLNVGIALRLVALVAVATDIVQVYKQRYQRLQSTRGIGQLQRRLPINRHLVHILLVVVFVGYT